MLIVSQANITRGTLFEKWNRPIEEAKRIPHI